MVKRSVSNIVCRPFHEGVPRPGPGVVAQVVELENLIKVRIISLGHIVRKVVQNMIQRRYGPAMVERAVTMGNDEDDGGVRSDDSPPSVERSQRIRDVFQDMGRQQKLVRRGLNVVHEGRLADQVSTPRCALGDDAEIMGGWFGFRPDCLRGKVIVIERSHDRIQGPEIPPPEDRTWSADLDAVAFAESLLYGTEGRGRDQTTGAPEDLP